MQVEFKSGIDRERATTVVEGVAALLEIPESAIERVIIADRYGEAIAEVLGQPGAKTHTDTRDMQGVGKTVPRRNTDGKVTSEIVLPTAVVEEALGHDAPDFRGDPLSAERCYYVIGHELGHAKDYAARGVVHPQAVDTGRPFRLEGHHRYCGRLLLEEYFACTHSGPLVSGRLL